VLLPTFWLYDFCDPGLDVGRLEHRLTMTGTKVERAYVHGVTALESFVVGRVLRASQHPDADRLTVCIVALGEGDTAQIVCGAPNVVEGATVAVARPGAVMPDGTRLKRAKLRGVESDGMILAEDEVGIGTDHAGIMVLDDDLVPGTPLADVLPIATDVLELEITPNRPDCLGVYGVAREVHAATGAPLTDAPWAGVPSLSGRIPGFEVEVRDRDLCPRFTLRRFEEVTIGPSPAWLKARLMAAGQRPINNVVDITNYVMLLTGQPMHAFDADLVQGNRLVVRRARDGETITTLDDAERALDSSVCLIEDAGGPTSIAGVMGGARSEVRPTTTRVLMEAATWNGPNIQRTSTRLGLRTEASGRFEKQLQPEQTMEAQAVAARLMGVLCGARSVGGTIDAGGWSAPPRRSIHLRDGAVADLLGAAPELPEQRAILERLGFGVRMAPRGLEVTVPHWRRGDVTREADLVEEVGRIWGLERLPITLPSRRGASGRLEPEQRLRRRAEDALAAAGVHEMLGSTFAPADAVDRLALPEGDERRRAVRILNPMSEEQATLRTLLLGSLLDVAARNHARGVRDVRLWEEGTVYVERAGRAEREVPLSALGRSSTAGTLRRPETVPGLDRLPDERRHAGALLLGRMRPRTWGEPDPPRAGFFTAKAVLAAMLDTLRVPWRVEAAREPFLHPGRAAAVIAGDGDGEHVGWVGELHPRVAARWELEETVAAFEVDLDRVVAHATLVPDYEDVTAFPSVLQDLAVAVPDTVTAAEVVGVARRAGGALLRSAEVFDVYRGAQIGKGRTSLALRLEFRAGDRTLTDEEADERRAKIVAALAERLGGELRG
jgi:phenylalanyl-tRNA synthetase beta chain